MDYNIFFSADIATKIIEVIILYQCITITINIFSIAFKEYLENFTEINFPFIEYLKSFVEILTIKKN